MADHIKDTSMDPAPKRPVKRAPLKEGPGSAGAPVLAVEPGTDDASSSHRDDADVGPNATQSIKDGAAKLARQATDKARDYVSEGKNRAGGALDEVSRLMGDAADTVDEKIGAQYGQYARTAAEGIAGFSESLKAKEIEDLVADATAFVRKSPAVAIGIAAALGFVVARLVKAGLDAADGDTPPRAPDA
ncbi:hypothetical protein [Sphingomonas sp. 28-62-11]|uniref:hypothetical protein n=1 Tax=Sphingomonas sp. 28-62-11 TaxID=1970432 RepID=UPI0035A969D4